MFIEISDRNFLIAVGEYDDELNFEILDKEKFPHSGFKNGTITDLATISDNLKKAINKIEGRSNNFFSSANLIINQTDFDCVNVSGFKKLNGSQVLSEDISYILNDVKLKLLEAEKDKTIIHLFNTKYLLDNKPIKNLPIGLHGDFYSHQLTFFMVKNNDLKNIKTLFNMCNLNLSKIILKSFTEGIKIIKEDKKDTFIKINIKKNETLLSIFYESSFCYFQKFNFGSDIILKDISKVCSFEMSKTKNIISETKFENLNENSYVDQKYFDDNNFRKISLKHIVEIASARIEEIVDVIFNLNRNIFYIGGEEILINLSIDDKSIQNKFKEIFKKNFNNCKLNFFNLTDQDNFTSIEIFGELLSKGWIKEAIPIVNKKKSWISSIFSSLFE